MADNPHSRRLDRLDRIAQRMDSAFRIPGTGIRLGYDSLLGLIPGIGDAAAMAPAAWIVLESKRMGAPPELLLRQGVNVGIDALVGTIPLIGDLFDVGFKANRKNVALLRSHLERQMREAPADGEGPVSAPGPIIEGRAEPR